jgi:hypothetical protein
MNPVTEDARPGLPSGLAFRIMLSVVKLHGGCLAAKLSWMRCNDPPSHSMCQGGQHMLAIILIAASTVSQ